MANDKQVLFDNVFERDSPGMSEWPATVQNVGAQLAEHQAKFGAAQARNESTNTVRPEGQDNE